MRIFTRILLAAALLPAVSCLGDFTVTATGSELIFRFDSKQKDRTVAELAPYEMAADAGLSTHPTFKAGQRKFSIPRFDGARDRIYSGFVETEYGTVDGPIRYVEAPDSISVHQDPYPKTRSKKGLQVQMVDDAVALGVQHAGFNVDIGGCVTLNPHPGDFAWPMDGRTFWFNRGYIEAIDHEVKTLSQTGATVTLILLNYSHPGSPPNAILQHPNYDTNCPGHISAFNTLTPEGVAWLKAWMEFLADRYSAPGFPHGRAVNYIIGNEVNAHWDWANMGNVTMEQFARDYARAVRICTMAVKKESATDRVFISLEHDWNHLFAESTNTHGFPARTFIDYFGQITKANGDFGWNLAFHPYPEDLFQCRTWEDKSAKHTPYSPRMTFKNIEQLPKYFRRKELLFQGKPRRIILSEQGFHAKPNRQGDLDQAAAYCYAWRKIVNLDGIDAFILHRHVDNGGEGGLNLGLWRREPDSVATPSTQRPMYDCFKYADTPEWKKHFQFALPIIGIKSWRNIDSK